MITSIAQPPKLVHDAYWERSLDPFHPEAFEQIKELHRYFSWWQKRKPRRDGWMAIDWVGNPVGWVADGTEIDPHGQEFILRESYKGRLCAVLNKPNCIQHFDETLKYIPEEKRNV